jgi:hypothetical protein
MELRVNPAGLVRCLYDEAIDVTALGAISVARAGFVEPDGRGGWVADLAPSGGPVLGPFPTRGQALLAERAWLAEHWLPRCPEPG